MREDVMRRSWLRLMLVVGQSLDAATFALFFLVVPASILAAMTHGEKNPIVATLFAIGGFGAVVAVKLGVTGLVVWRDSRRRDRPVKTGVFMFVAATSGFVGAAFNVYTLGLVVEALRV